MPSARALMIIINENQKILRLVGSNPPMIILKLKEDSGMEALSTSAAILEKIKDLQASEMKV